MQIEFGEEVILLFYVKKTVLDVRTTFFAKAGRPSKKEQNGRDHNPHTQRFFPLCVL